ncbi:MAG: choice-of-anchor X domain-containing protein, partial [Calditrichia bacterium]
MKQISKIGVILVLLLAAGMLSAQVDVTFRVNASTAEGFTDSTDVIQVRGGTAPLQWNSSSPALINVGGDYWVTTVTFDNANVGSTVEYKYGATRDDLTTGTTYDWWEDLPGGGNRSFVLPAQDTTLDLAYLSALEPPYTPSDSFDVYFRVNMVANQGFDPANDIVSLVGDFPAPDGAANMWSPGTYQLTRESSTSNYWSYHLKLANPSTAYASAGTVDSVYYRFVIGNDWSNTEQIFGHGMFPNNENRGTVVRSDTTLAWKYWNDVPPGQAGNDTVSVKFRADLTRAINENGFSIGDTLIVRYGYNFTAEFEEDTMTNVFLTNFYEANVDAKNVALGADLQYQYYTLQNGTDYREIFFDFDDPVTGSQEKRKVYIPDPAPAQIVARDTVASETDLHRMPRFRNTRLLSQDVLVTYSVDLRPPYYQVLMENDTIQNIQGSSWWVYPGQQDSIFSWGVYMNGPGNGTAGWQGWNQIDLSPYEMFDDGTHGDVTAGDSIYTYQVLFSPDSGDVVGQEFKFGIGAGDNEGGNTGYGLNHFENIDDSQPSYTIHSDFGSINPNFYWRWDFQNHVVGIEGQGDVTV